MMSFPYLWRIPESFPQSWIPEYDHDVSPDSLLYKEARALEVGGAVPVFRSPAKPSGLRKWDVLPNSGGVPLVNQRVADLVRAMGPRDAQFIPARVVASRDEDVPGYYVINVLQAVRGIDWSESDAERFAGALQGFNRLRFLPNCLGEKLLAREEEYPPILLVGEEFVRRFKEEGLKGAKFERAEEIHW